MEYFIYTAIVGALLLLFLRRDARDSNAAGDGCCGSMAAKLPQPGKAPGQDAGTGPQAEAAGCCGGGGDHAGHRTDRVAADESGCCGGRGPGHQHHDDERPAEQVRP